VVSSEIVCCIRSSGAVPTEAAASEAVHVLFDIAGSRRLSLPDLASPYAGVVYLGHRILENPSDLRSHVQRILLLIDSGDEPDLQGALVDLFIALGDKGGGLKQRLLDLAAPRLPRTVMVFLRQRLATGIKPWEAAVSRMRASLLSLGFSGVHEVVRRRDRESASAYANAVEEAHACLEYGQVDTAREVLERALLQDPGNDAVAAELLTIYRCTRDDERRVATHQFLLAALPHLPASWQVESSTSAGLSQASTATHSRAVPPMDEQSRS
jgi:hypothetical protein